MTIAYAIGLLLGSYIMGSIPTGYWLCKALKGIDIRTVGSGSTGATNVLRACGKGPAIFVLVADVFKGYMPVAIAVWLEPTVWVNLPFNFPHMIPALVAIIAIVGHSKSIFLGFTGGKSAATTLGTLIGLQPVVSGLTFGSWLLLVVTTKIVSLASVVAAVLCPIFMFVCQAPPAVLVFSLAAAFVVIARHKANIKRLMEGTEPRIGQKGKAPSAETNINIDSENASTETTSEVKRHE